VTYDLNGRTVLVTGGSRGVGSAVVRELSARGANVAFTYRRAADEAEAVLNQTKGDPGRVFAFQAPIDNRDAMTEVLGSIHEVFGAVDALVSNAGTASTGRSVLETPEDEFHRLMGVHTWGPLALIRQLIPEMRLSERADIIVVSSVTTDVAPANSAPYVMAKAALEMAVRTIAREERAYGIRANAVAPGLVATDMGARLVNATMGGRDLHELDAAAPFGRVCLPEDVAAVVGFLLSHAGSYMTGQRLVVDGGGPVVGVLE